MRYILYMGILENFKLLFEFLNFVQCNTQTKTLKI